MNYIRRKIAEYKELRYLAYHDTLTGLLNRNWLYKNITNIKLKYVYFIDVNDLHTVNIQGHTFGDKHLNKCVKSIVLDNTDVLVRYAGDEFILFSDIKNKIETIDLFAVGMCEFIDSNSINIADGKMIKSKLLWKSKRGEEKNKYGN